MFHVYILQNPAGRFYIGHTDDLERNEPEGRSHLGKYTHQTGPWTLVWSERHPDRSSPVLREREIKPWKSARSIKERLLQHAAQR